MLFSATGCAPENDGASSEDARSGDDAVTGALGFTVFPDPFGDGTANPAAGIRGGVWGHVQGDPGDTYDITDFTISGLFVLNLPPNRTFGAHAHVLSCADQAGGGHYQHETGSIDPDTSEIWLDFTTDAFGTGYSEKFSSFAVREGGVRSIVVHANPTNPETAKAGPKLACADIVLE
jgi:hypothetical protein